MAHYFAANLSLKGMVWSGEAWRGRCESIERPVSQQVPTSADRPADDQVFLTPTPPLTAELSDRPIPPTTELKAARVRYAALLRNLMRAPDGSHDESYLLSGQAEPLTPAGKPESDWEKNNPLSLDEQVRLPRRSECP